MQAIDAASATAFRDATARIATVYEAHRAGRLHRDRAERIARGMLAGEIDAAAGTRALAGLREQVLVDPGSVHRPGRGAGRSAGPFRRPVARRPWIRATRRRRDRARAAAAGPGAGGGAAAPRARQPLIGAPRSARRYPQLSGGTELRPDRVRLIRRRPRAPPRALANGRSGGYRRMPWSPSRPATSFPVRVCVDRSSVSRPRPSISSLPRVASRWRSRRPGHDRVAADRHRARGARPARPPWAWPGIALGAFLANLTADEPVATAAVIAIGNTLEAVARPGSSRRLAFRPDLARLRDAIALVLFAARRARSMARRSACSASAPAACSPGVRSDRSGGPGGSATRSARSWSRRSCWSGRPPPPARAGRRRARGGRLLVVTTLVSASRSSSCRGRAAARAIRSTTSPSRSSSGRRSASDSAAPRR